MQPCRAYDHTCHTLCDLDLALYSPSSASFPPRVPEFTCLCLGDSGMAVWCPLWVGGE